jgi:hypothetical protein
LGDRTSRALIDHDRLSRRDVFATDVSVGAVVPSQRADAR